MLLMAGVLAVTDQKNVAPPAWFTGPLVGLLVVAHRRRVRLQRRLRHQPGARFRSAPVHVVAGWGSGVFTAGNGWWWVPIVAPIVGAVLGAWLYDVFVNKHHAAPEAGR